MLSLFGGKNDNTEDNADDYKSGSGNGILDALLGGMAGGADSSQSNQPRGYYIPRASWRGNGIADTGIQYLANPYYRDERDYSSGGRMLGSIFGGSSLKDILGMTGMGGSSESEGLSGGGGGFPLLTQAFNLPSLFSGNNAIGGNTIGDYGNAYNSFYDYSLPTSSSSNFNLDFSSWG